MSMVYGGDVGQIALHLIMLIIKILEDVEEIVQCFQKFYTLILVLEGV